MNINYKNLFVKIHKYYFSFAYCAGIILGAGLGGFFRVDHFALSFWVAISLVILIICFYSRMKILIVLMVLAGFFLGANFMSNYLKNYQKISKFSGQIVNIRGTISEDIDRKSSNEFSAKITLKSINNQPFSGNTFANFKSKKSPRRSDEIIFSGKMGEGFGNFAGSFYRIENIKIIPKSDLIRDLRDSFAEKIREFIPSPEVDLGLGYILGQKNSLPNDLDNALKIVALTHVVVASGYNLTILVRFSRRTFLKISKNFSFVMSAVLIIGFVFMIGFTPSMVRAGLVALISLVIWNFGRKVQPLFLITFVAALTILISPGSVFDLGWQLSFGSFFGIMILAPLLTKFFFSKTEKVGSITQIIIETFSAQAATLPLILMTFGEFSIISILANILILPFIPLAMILTFLTGIFGFFVTPIAQLFAFFSRIILKYSIEIVQTLAQINGFTIRFSADIWFVMIFYIGLAGFCIFLNHKTKADLSDSNVVI